MKTPIKDPLFPRITHAIVKMLTLDQIKEHGYIGVVILCFGPSEDDAITQIQLSRAANGHISWSLPQVSVGEKRIPVFKGRAAGELSERVREVYDMMKANVSVKAGHWYRVIGNKVEDISSENPRFKTKGQVVN